LKEGKSKEKDRGFKTAPDGRLIIEDIEDQDTDSDDDDMNDYQDKSKKEVYDEASDDEGGPSSKKKVALNPYQAGGSGIHRPLAASVKSGYSKSSKVSAMSRAPGSEYKSSKAGGDVKKKGKHEPYAYVQLSRNSLNRRKRKGAGQFKSISKKSKGGKKGKGRN
jgi:ribosomal RNA-processing protein 12